MYFPRRVADTWRLHLAAAGSAAFCSAM